MAYVKICDMRSCRKELGDDLFQQPVVIMGKGYDLCQDCVRHLEKFVQSKLAGGYPVMEQIPIIPDPAPDLSPLYPFPPITSPSFPLPNMPPIPEISPLQDDISSGRVIWTDNRTVTEMPPLSRPRGSRGS